MTSTDNQGSPKGFYLKRAGIGAISAFFLTMASGIAQANEGQPVKLKPSQAVSLDGSEPILGDAKARFLLVGFSDFECPACAYSAPKINEMVQQYKAHLKMAFKHYPLSNICNENMSRPAHDKACMAAVAADCAQAQGLFWEMANSLLTNQSFINETNIRIMAEQVKLDAIAFEQCFSKMDYSGIKADIKAADAVNIQGTPSYYLNDAKTNLWYEVKHTEDLPSMLKTLNPALSID